MSFFRSSSLTENEVFSGKPGSEFFSLLMKVGRCEAQTSNIAAAAAENDDNDPSSSSSSKGETDGQVFGKNKRGAAEL